jgi:hypothetical protein
MDDLDMMQVRAVEEMAESVRMLALAVSTVGIGLALHNGNALEASQHDDLVERLIFTAKAITWTHKCRQDQDRVK